MDWESELNRFRENISEKKRIKLTKVKSCDSIETAVDLAYNDAKRTFSGIAELEEEKRDALKGIEKEIFHYFDGQAPATAEKFDKTHHTLCQIWCKTFAGNSIATYGRAQKIVNMAFKYLMCCDDAQSLHDYFKYCHMPLDSYVLEWCSRRITGTDINWTKQPWSNLDEDQYKKLQKEIRTKVQNISLLQQEFIIWPEIQKELAVESMLSCFDPDYPGSNKKKKEYANRIKSQSLEEKLRKVKGILEHMK